MIFSKNQKLFFQDLQKIGRSYRGTSQNTFLTPRTCSGELSYPPTNGVWQKNHEKCLPEIWHKSKKSSVFPPLIIFVPPYLHSPLTWGPCFWVPSELTAHGTHKLKLTWYLSDTWHGTRHGTLRKMWHCRYHVDMQYRTPKAPPPRTWYPFQLTAKLRHGTRHEFSHGKLTLEQNMTW